jgi:hypothetical protein
MLNTPSFIHHWHYITSVIDSIIKQHIQRNVQYTSVMSHMHHSQNECDQSQPQSGLATYITQVSNTSCNSILFFIWHMLVTMLFSFRWLKHAKFMYLDSTCM